MTRGNEGLLVQDRSDLNETVVESFPHAPHPDPPRYDNSSASPSEKDEKKDFADGAYVKDGEVHDNEGIVVYDEHGREKVLGELVDSYL
jgi:hypothetical protein